MSNFRTFDLNGNEVTSAYFNDKKVTLIFVWATYCGYCRDEMPTLQKLDEEYKDFGVLGVCVDLLDRKDNIDAKQLKKAKSIVEKIGLEAPSVLPVASMQKLLANATSLPYGVFVDSEGNQLGIGFYGLQKEERLRASIDRYLN